MKPDAQYLVCHLPPLEGTGRLRRLLEFVQRYTDVSLTHQGDPGAIVPLKEDFWKTLEARLTRKPFRRFPPLLSRPGEGQSVAVAFSNMRGPHGEVMASTLSVHISRAIADDVFLSMMRDLITEGNAFGASARIYDRNGNRPLNVRLPTLCLFGAEGMVGLSNIEHINFINDRTAARYRFPSSEDQVFRGIFRGHHGGWILSAEGLLEPGGATEMAEIARNYSWIAERFMTAMTRPGQLTF